MCTRVPAPPSTPRECCPSTQLIKLSSYQTPFWKQNLSYRAPPVAFLFNLTTKALDQRLFLMALCKVSMPAKISSGRPPALLVPWRLVRRAVLAVTPGNTWPPSTATLASDGRLRLTSDSTQHRYRGLCTTLGSAAGLYAPLKIFERFVVQRSSPNLNSVFIHAAIRAQWHPESVTVFLSYQTMQYLCCSRDC